MSNFSDLLSQFTAVSLGIFIEALPFLLLGTLASGLVEVFFAREELARLLPRHPLVGGIGRQPDGLIFTGVRMRGGSARPAGCFKRAHPRRWASLFCWRRR